MKYDVIIIGAGHNGLVAAGYLAKAGYKVAVLEKRHTVGGCAVTEEKWPGFKVSRLSYVNSLFRPEIVDHLELKKYGYEMLPRNPSSFTPFPDGRHLLLGPDQKMNQEQISKFSKKDAEAYPRYEEELTKISEVLEPLMTMVPLNPSKLSFNDLTTYGKFGLKNRALLKEKGPEIFRFMTGSATDMLNEWFESDELKATLATDAVIGANASPAMPGTAYILFHHVMGECNGVRGVWGYMRGGMGGLSQALAASCRNLGVQIFTETGAKAIWTQNGAVKGVIAEGGKEFLADTVISNADPNVTFRKLMDEAELPEEFLRNVKRINYDSASVKINLALSELPDFAACPSTGKDAEGKPIAGPQHRGTIHISPTTQYIEEAYADSVAGRPSRSPILECTIPSVIDNTVAPSGKHIMNIFVQYGPYQLKNGKTWDDEGENFGDRCVEILNSYARNFKKSVLHREVITPVDMEKEFHITGGNIFHGRLTLDQMFHMRPVPGFANYRTPVKGLYLCGSGTHPGGGVMGTPGLNASKEVIRDLK